MKRIISMIMVTAFVLTPSISFAKSDNIMYERCDRIITQKMIDESNEEFDKVLYSDEYDDGIKTKDQLVLSKGTSGTYPKRAGVILTTPDNENSTAALFKLGHAAIVLDVDYVVEAVAKGVKKGKNN